MQVKGLFKDYALPGLLDKLDVIEYFEQPGEALRVGEILDAKAKLYYDPGDGSASFVMSSGNVGYNLPPRSPAPVWQVTPLPEEGTPGLVCSWNTAARRPPHRSPTVCPLVPPRS